MTLPLLQTKMTIPAVRRQAIARPRLLARLDEVVQNGYKLALLSAPAGYGKTSLLAAWAAALPGRFSIRPAWLKLEPTENDPRRFWNYSLAALQQGYPQVGQSAASLLHADPGVPIENVLTLWLADLEQLDEKVVWVLDDFHQIQSLDILKGLAFFLEHLPAMVHLVIAGRSDPFLPLPRLRARNEVLELRLADLAFDPVEAAAFFTQTMHLDLPEGLVGDITGQTRGWIAGLQLAGLSLQRNPATNARPSGATYAAADLFQFFKQEVLASLPEDRQRFLFEISILDLFSADLCQQVTRRSDSAALLEQFERENLFLSALDLQGTVFQFHPLFRELLNQELRLSVSTGEILELHQRAADWLEQHGQAEAAFSQALAGAAYPQAERLLVTLGLERILAGEGLSIYNFCLAFPEAYRRESAQVNLLAGWALLAAARFEQVEPYLAAAEAAQTGSGAMSDDVRGQLAAIRATVAFNLKDISRSMDQANLALTLLPEEAYLVRSVVMLDLADSLLIQGDIDAARLRYLETAEYAGRAGNRFVQINCLAMAGRALFWQGRLHEAETMARQAIHLAESTGQANLPILGLVEAVLAEIRLARQQPEQAWEWITKSLDHFRMWGHPNHIVQATLAEIEILAALGKLDEALDQVIQVRLLIQQQRLMLSQSRAESAAAGIYLQKGQAGLARETLLAAGLVTKTGAEDPAYQPVPFSDPIQIFSYPIGIRLLYELGQANPALAWLEAWLAPVKAKDFRGQAIRLLTLRALIERQQGRLAAALVTLEQALSQAEPEGFIHAFVKEGQPVQELIQAWLGLPDRPDVLVVFARRLLLCFNGTTLGQAEPLTPALNSETLSPREGEVLRLVAAGMTNEDIARELYVSTNTIKTHLKRIYDKLGVNDRWEAVRVARLTGLKSRN